MLPHAGAVWAQLHNLLAGRWERPSLLQRHACCCQHCMHRSVCLETFELPSHESACCSVCAALSGKGCLSTPFRHTENSVLTRVKVGEQFGAAKMQQNTSWSWHLSLQASCIQDRSGRLRMASVLALPSWVLCGPLCGSTTSPSGRSSGSQPVSVFLHPRPILLFTHCQYAARASGLACMTAETQLLGTRDKDSAWSY